MFTVYVADSFIYSTSRNSQNQHFGILDANILAKRKKFLGYSTQLHASPRQINVGVGDLTFAKVR